MNEHTAYLCGFLCSRGKVVWDEKTGNYALVLQTKEREMALLFAKGVKAAFGEPRVYEKDRYMLVVFHGKGEAKQLLGAGSFGEYNWTVPAVCFEDAWLGKAFLQGFFDAGGNVKVRESKTGRRRTIRVNSVNKAGLLSVKQLLGSFGMGANVYKAGRGFCLDIEGKTRCSVFMEKVGFRHAGKADMLIKAMEYRQG